MLLGRCNHGFEILDRVSIRTDVSKFEFQPAQDGHDPYPFKVKGLKGKCEAEEKLHVSLIHTHTLT